MEDNKPVTTKSAEKIADDLSYDIADRIIDYIRAPYTHSEIRLKILPICHIAVDKMERKLCQKIQ